MATAPAFEWPEDLKGKSPEDLAKLILDGRKDFDTYKGEWEPRKTNWAAYEKLGKPEEIDQVIKWGKTNAPLFDKIAKGELKVLNDADYKAFENWSKTQKGGKPAEGAQPTGEASEELLAPMRTQLLEELKKSLTEMVGGESKRYQAELQRGLKQLVDQQNLFSHVMNLKAKYPTLDFEALMKEGADLATMSPDKLLESLIQSRLKEATMNDEIEKQVQAKLGAKKTDEEADRVKALLEARRVGPGAVNGKPKREDVMKGLVSTLTEKYPGIFNALPVT